MDISDTIKAKSDQLNAEDLIAGPITVTITGVKRTADEQPLAIEISGGHKPWMPCKTMRRLLIMAWPDCVIPPVPPATEPTIDPRCWIGRSVTLVRDPSVKWAGDMVGGVRVAALSHIKAQFEVALAESKKKKKLVTVARLDVGSSGQPTPKRPAAASIEARLTSMKDDWKASRVKRGEVVTSAEFVAFVERETSGLVLAADGLVASSYSESTLTVCEAAVLKMGTTANQGGDLF